MSRASNGKGSVFRSKDTKGWEGWVSLGVHPDNGKRRRRKVRGRTKTEVQAKVDQLNAQFNRSILVMPPKTTLSEWLEAWYERHAPSVRPSTLSGYRTDLRYVERSGIGAVRLKDVTENHIQHLFKWIMTPQPPIPGSSAKGKRAFTVGTVLHTRRTLWQPLRLAVEGGYLQTNPMKAAEVPTGVGPGPEPYDLEDIPTIVHGSRQRRNGVRWELALLGLRSGEVHGLCWSDIDLQRNRLKVRHSMNWLDWSHGCSPASARPDASPAHAFAPAKDAPCGHSPGYCPRRRGGGPVFGPTKTEGSVRTLTLPASTKQRLVEHQKVQAEERAAAGNCWENWDLVIATAIGRPVDRTSDSEEWSAVKQAIFTESPRSAEQLDHRVHDLRHTATTALQDKQLPSPVILRTMGWTTEHELLRYAHVRQEARDLVAACQDEMFALPEDGGS